MTGISELELGLAAEYLVCADLILQGYKAMMAAPGLPYDVVVGFDTRLLRVQVKATQQAGFMSKKDIGKKYRFGVRRGKSVRRVDITETDWFAFVALDIRRVAYLPITEMISKHGGIKLLMEFKTRGQPYRDIRYKVEKGRYIEDFGVFGGFNPCNTEQ